MSSERATPSGLRPASVVPLEAGAGPENPPCPACGEPLFGWIDLRSGLAGPVSRCESCGLGVVGESGGVAEALAALDHFSDGEVTRIANRGGFAAWIGGAGWAGLQPGSRYLFTVESVRRLVANRDQVVTKARWSPGAGITTMWQTILNGFTFGRNVALGALGRTSAVPAEKPLATPPRRPDLRSGRNPSPTRGRPIGANGRSHETWQRHRAALRAALSD